MREEELEDRVPSLANRGRFRGRDRDRSRPGRVTPKEPLGAPLLTGVSEDRGREPREQRERQRDSDRDRQRDSDTDRQRDSERDRQRERDRDSDRQRERPRGGRQSDSDDRDRGRDRARDRDAETLPDADGCVNDGFERQTRQECRTVTYPECEVMDKVKYRTEIVPQCKTR